MPLLAIHFAALDYALIAAFILLVAVLSFSSRLKQNSMLQFLAAGRSLSLPIFVASLVSTWYGGILGVSESVADFGIGTWLLFGVPYYLFGIIYALFFAKKVRFAEQLSLPERIGSRFGKTPAVVTACLVFLLAVPAAHVYMLGILIQSMTDWPLIPCIVGGGFLGALFLVKGGLLADAKLGVVAFLGMYIGFFVIDGYCFLHYPIGHAIESMRSQDLLHFTGKQGILAIVSFFILGAWTLVDPAFHQRVASASSPEVGQKGVFYSVLFWMLFDFLSTIAGLYALVLLTHRPENSVSIFPLFGDQILPAGLKGIFFIGMFGTILSAMVGYTLVSGATFGRELVARWKPELTEAQVTAWSRFGLFVGCSVAIGVAIVVNSVVDIWYSWSGALVGALLIPVSVAYLKKSSSFSPISVTISMALSFFVAVSWLAYGKRTHNDFLTVTVLRESFSLGTLVPALVISGTVLGIASLANRGFAGK